MLERWLHDLGYRYTGTDSMYSLTLIEIDHLVVAERVRWERSEGIRSSDLVRAAEYAEREGLSLYTDKAA